MWRGEATQETVALTLCDALYTCCASAQLVAPALGRPGRLALLGLLLDLAAQLPRAEVVEGQPAEARHLHAHPPRPPVGGRAPQRRSAGVRAGSRP